MVKAPIFQKLKNNSLYKGYESYMVIVNDAIERIKKDSSLGYNRETT